MPNIETLDLSEPDTQDLFASPSRSNKKAAVNVDSKDAPAASAAITPKIWNGESRYDNEEAREASLRRELQSVRSINRIIEGVVESLERAKGNMEVNWS